MMKMVVHAWVTCLVCAIHQSFLVYTIVHNDMAGKQRTCQDKSWTSKLYGENTFPPQLALKEVKYQNTLLKFCYFIFYIHCFLKTVCIYHIRWHKLFNSTVALVRYKSKVLQCAQGIAMCKKDLIDT